MPSWTSHFIVFCHVTSEKEDIDSIGGRGAKNIDYNRMELRKIWHGGRFSVRASKIRSVVPAAELLIGQIGPRSFSLVRLVPEAEILIGCQSPRKIITVTCGDKIEGKLHHAQLVLDTF